MKKTLQEKLAARKYKIPNRFFNLIYYVIMHNIVGKKYNYNITVKDDINECKGACFLIWNHLSRIDHMYLMSAAFPRPLSIVAGYNEFFRSHLHLAFSLMKIIPKKVFTQDMNGLRAMNSIIRKGGCVAFSPEGTSSIYGCNQPIVPGTGKFIKHYHIPVYMMKLKGTYLTSTKMCLDERYGRTEGELYLLFTPEQLDNMTAEEIDERINLEFRHDEYDWAAEQGIKWENGGNMCERLYDMCYKCPRCGAELNMTAENNYIRCNACGNGAVMNDYYKFEPFDDECVIPKSPTKWVELERQAIIKEIRVDENYSFSEKVRVGTLLHYRYVPKKETSVPAGEGTIVFDHSGIHFSGLKEGENWSFDVSYETAFSLSIVTDTSRFAMYIEGEFYEFMPERPSVGKMLILTEEMHRLHYNVWKNFPWNEFMYKD